MNGKKVYFMGIAGTGMASVAGLAKQDGWDVSGSDDNIYPPMSTMLEDVGISVQTPYDESRLAEIKPDLVVVANVLSKTHKEVAELLKLGIPYTSFPKFLGENFLAKRHSVVVAGTHGKTTTTSLLTHILKVLGEDPGYMIGGIPKAFKRSFDLGKGMPFVVEGDEYDTAYFDKESKFLHYRAQHLILNNIEFDHADIFKDLDAIYKMFEKLVAQIKDPSQIMANIDDPGVVELLKRSGLEDKVTPVAAWGKSKEAPFRVLGTKVLHATAEQQTWEVEMRTRRWGDLKVKTSLSGDYNAANLCQIMACLDSMMTHGIISESKISEIQAAVLSFQNVKRRLDCLGEVHDIIVMEDFAHHPTAVKLLIQSLKKNFPSRRLLVAFEPRNATSRRNTFEKQYGEVLSLADVSLIGACPEDKRIPEHERMNTSNIAASIGSSAQAFSTNDSLHDWLLNNLLPQDVVVFMSSGSFNGIQHRLVQSLFTKYGKEPPKGVEIRANTI
jgi:UDP-N-acetylmuramate: L-alanyl-gamma-D-glutamyl-meso-diaminopimelate ligase